jgi:NSS family neurotransmitter:Na+ symporter
MRLVLPVVVAYIGLQYGFSGLIAMCDRAPDAAWCHADWQEQTESPDPLLTEPSPSASDEPDQDPSP